MSDAAHHAGSTAPPAVRKPSTPAGDAATKPKVKSSGSSNSVPKKDVKATGPSAPATIRMPSHSKDVKTPASTTKAQSATSEHKEGATKTTAASHTAPGTVNHGAAPGVSHETPTPQEAVEQKQEDKSKPKKKGWFSKSLEVIDHALDNTKVNILPGVSKVGSKDVQTSAATPPKTGATQAGAPPSATHTTAPAIPATAIASSKSFFSKAFSKGTGTNAASPAAASSSPAAASAQPQDDSNDYSNAQPGVSTSAAGYGSDVDSGYDSRNQPGATSRGANNGNDDDDGNSVADGLEGAAAGAAVGGAADYALQGSENGDTPGVTNL